MGEVSQSAIDELLAEVAAGDAAGVAAAEAEAAAPLAQPSSYASIEPGAANWPLELRRLVTIEVPVIVQLAQRRMSLNEVMRLAVGAIVEFHKPADQDLQLLVNNKIIAEGQAVKVGENFGLRLRTVGTIKETIQKLGA
jgi:flagellar motor switch protein FliN/FliY